MTGSAQLLGDGISITFAAITGHTTTDEWEIVGADLGCWQVNGVLGPDCAASTTQAVPLFSLPANGFVSGISIKTALVFTGTTTATTGIGTTSSVGKFVAASAYDLLAAVNDTNIYNTLAAAGRATKASENVTADLVVTCELITDFATGVAADYWVLWAVLP